jgi:DNA-binding SARP family transcriptional activator
MLFPHRSPAGASVCWRVDTRAGTGGAGSRMLVHVQLLGHFRVTVDGRLVPVEHWRRARSVALVKLLALSPGYRLHRDQAMDLLWPELDLEAAAGNLRKAVHYTRQALGAHDVIKLYGEVLALAPDAELVVDAARFEADAQAALTTRDASACQLAAERYSGELLPDDRYAAWAEEPRERLRQLYTRVLKTGQLWERMLEADPTDEEAQRAVMQAALDAGNRGEVIRQFQRLRERLRVELGLGPSRPTIAIYERALTPAAEEPASVAEHVGALLAWGIVHLGSGNFGDAERAAREARTLSLEAGLGREMGEASALLGLVAHMQGRWLDLFQSEFVTWIRQGPTAATNVFDGHLCLAEFCLCGAGGHDAIAAAARGLLTTAEDERSAAGRALALLILGEAQLFAGHLDAAEELLTHADRLHQEVGATAGHALSRQRLGEVALARGQKWRAGRLLRSAQKSAEASWLEPHLLIRLQGLAVEAAPTTAKVMEAITQGDVLLARSSTCRPCSMGFRVASSMALAQAGELATASRRLDETERLAGMWQGGPWVAAVWEARGVLRRAQGRVEQAAALLHEAAVRYGELGRRADAARCEARAAALAIA